MYFALFRVPSGEHPHEPMRTSPPTHVAPPGGSMLTPAPASITASRDGVRGGSGMGGRYQQQQPAVVATSHVVLSCPPPPATSASSEDLAISSHPHDPTAPPVNADSGPPDEGAPSASDFSPPSLCSTSMSESSDFSPQFDLAGPRSAVTSPASPSPPFTMAAACIKFAASRTATQAERFGAELARHLGVTTPQVGGRERGEVREGNEYEVYGAL